MRATYLVCYDVRDQKRLRRTFKICKNFGIHLQFSVFECDLNASELAEMDSLLREVLALDQDQVLFIRLGPAESRGNRVITALGIPYTSLDSPCYVV